MRGSWPACCSTASGTSVMIDFASFVSAMTRMSGSCSTSCLHAVREASEGSLESRELAGGLELLLEAQEVGGW